MRYLIELQQKYLRHAARAEKRHGSDHPAVIYYQEAAMRLTPLLNSNLQIDN